MQWRALQLLGTVLTCLGIVVVQAGDQPSGTENLDVLQEKAIRDAVQKVAPSVVQIETSGGTDVITPSAGPGGRQGGGGGGGVRKGMGPTTGLVVAADGYVISSAFNFANKPTSIFVAVPGREERYVAKVVSTDESRMLTLLKIDAGDLPVPAAAPKKDVQVGQTAIALGRTLDPMVNHAPSVSVGIISAVQRIWGKAMQTDAKVSPTNYGGPLVDIQGRVDGVLVPASPSAEGETAGIEWYDSGIGFAVPLEDIFAVLPRLRDGKNLKKGILGVNVQVKDRYSEEPKIATVAPDTAASRAGIEPGDVVKEIDGKVIVNHAQMLHAMGTKYEGDVISVKVRRGKQEKMFTDLRLGGNNPTFLVPVLGILPMRDDPKKGVEIRYVFPDGPAAAAGLKPGDRITKIGGTKGALKTVGTFDQLVTNMNPPLAGAGTKVRVQVTHKNSKKSDTVSLTLGGVPNKDRPEAVPENLPTPASYKKAKGKKSSKETGRLKRSNAAGDHHYWINVPDNYDPNIGYALLIWLHPEGKGKDKDIETFLDFWFRACKDNNIIIACPTTENVNGWTPSDMERVQEVVKDVTSNYTVDTHRVVAHGLGRGGQMAFYLGFHVRNLIRGVVATGAVLNTAVKEKIGNQPISFLVMTGDRDPLAKDISEGKDKLLEQKYSVIYREFPEIGHQYTEDMVTEIARWIDSMDRL